MCFPFKGRYVAIADIAFAEISDATFRRNIFNLTVEQEIDLTNQVIGSHRNISLHMCGIYSVWLLQVEHDSYQFILRNSR